MTRSSFACTAERHLADLVEEDGAALRRSRMPGLVCTRAGEGAALVAEELALEERLRAAPRS